MSRVLVLCLLALVACQADAKLFQSLKNNLKCLLHKGPCYKRTIIVIHKETVPEQYLYVRGGAFGSGEPIAIKHRIEPENPDTYYGLMSANDRNLSWDGGEREQGSFHGEPAQGTPMMWTTNQTDYEYDVERDGAGYHPMNNLGPHYWLVDLDMDCSKLGNDGLFEFKGYLVNRRTGVHTWETSNPQRAKCGLDENQSADGNHVGRCGKLNAVEFNGDICDVVTAIE